MNHKPYLGPARKFTYFMIFISVFFVFMPLRYFDSFMSQIISMQNFHTKKVLNENKNLANTSGNISNLPERSDIPQNRTTPIIKKKKIQDENSKSSNSRKGKLSCTTKRHFAYIKTHKTGSSTIYSVLEELVSKYKLNNTVAVPFPLVGGYPGHVEERFIFRRVSGRFVPIKEQDNVVLMGHYRFNSTALRNILHEDTVYISIVREPWRNFQSSYHYYYKRPVVSKFRFKSICVTYPFFHIAKGRKVSIFEYLKITRGNIPSSVPWYFRSKNYQSHSLGLDPMLEDNEEITKAVQNLGKEIDLMMITEYMDESMILLKHLMCLDWEDILYLNFNRNRYKFNGIDDDLEGKGYFKQLYKSDIALYQYFNQTFWKKVEEYGRERMNRDVKKLRNLLTKKRQKDKHSRKKRDNPQPDLRSPEEVWRDTKSQYNRKSMTKILHKRIADEVWIRLKEEQINAITEKMINNGGGCPM